MRAAIGLLVFACGESPLLVPPEDVPVEAHVPVFPFEAELEPPVQFDAIEPPPPPPPPPATEAAPDPSVKGPWNVGVATIEMTDPSRDRTFLVDVWYPTTATGDPKRYTIETDLGLELASLDGTAIEGAPIASGTFPLVLFSHGYGGIRFQSFFLTEHLASHGYVVAAPDHPGNRLSDFRELGSDDAALQSSIDRPLDMLFVRDALLADPSFDIDPARVAMSGHSFGGWTTFEVGRRDPTIAAFVPLAPGFRFGATPDMASELDGRPILIFGGSVDTTCSYDENQLPAYEAALPPKAVARIEGAGHLDFSNLCDIALARLFVDDGCDPASIDPALVQTITETLTTAFLGAHLKGLDYSDQLAPPSVSALGPVHYLASP